MASDAANLSKNAASHGALLTIDLNALVENWRLLARRAGPAACGAAVKADAYGIGLSQAVPALAAAGCQSFFVAHLEEGIAARHLAPTADIHVLNGYIAGTGPAYVAQRLRPVLGSAEEVADWAHFANGGGENLPPATLHVDTGMNRLGCDAELARQIGRDRPFPIGLLMSHFVSSEIADAAINDRQIADFSAIRPFFAEVPASLANSSGIFLPSRPLFDLVRPGYALYGGNPIPAAANPMRPVVTLSAPILQIRTVPAGATVGYNATWTAPRPSRLATLSVGYADGWPRVGGDRPGQGAVLIEGHRCPFVGRVSMDLAVVDVTDLPEGAARRGGQALLLGSELTIDAVAQEARDIGYTLLVALGRRYRRQYLPVCAKG